MRAEQGLVVSGEKLVNNREFRDALLKEFQTAIGGEMEGAGAYTAAAREHVEVLLVKAICGWADGQKDDRAQQFAAFAAVSLAEHVLSKPDVLAHLGARGVEAGSRAAPVQSMGFANEVQSAKGDPMPVNPGGVGPGSAPASEAARGGEDAPGPDSAPRVFLSHSSHDKAFVRRLTNDLNALNLNLWLDERELRPGDSIVGGIDKGLREADYLVVVLSQASVASKWVTAEMNAVLMRQFSDKGVTVVPVLIEDCPIPLMIRDRVYADFRTNYQAGFTRLRRVFEQESRLTRTAQVHRAAGAGDDLAVRLGEMSAADLRRLLGKAMSRPLVATLWYDTFGSRMDDDMANRSKEECVIELLLRADERKRMPALIGHIVKECPSLLDP